MVHDVIVGYLTETGITAICLNETERLVTVVKNAINNPRQFDLASKNHTQIALLRGAFSVLVACNILDLSDAVQHYQSGIQRNALRWIDESFGRQLHQIVPEAYVRLGQIIFHNQTTGELITPEWRDCVQQALGCLEHNVQLTPEFAQTLQYALSMTPALPPHELPEFAGPGPLDLINNHIPKAVREMTSFNLHFGELTALQIRKVELGHERMLVDQIPSDTTQLKPMEPIPEGYLIHPVELDIWKMALRQDLKAGFISLQQARAVLASVTEQLSHNLEERRLQRHSVTHEHQRGRLLVHIGTIAARVKTIGIQLLDAKEPADALDVARNALKDLGKTLTGEADDIERKVKGE
jgi:hypothetical protein